MSCRCSDIRKCGKDIRKIENARNYFDKVCRVNEYNIKTHLDNLELNHTLCITPDNIDVLSEVTIQSNDVCRQEARSLLEDSNRELANLRRELSYMEDEDEDYHDDDD